MEFDPDYIIKPLEDDELEEKKDQKGNEESRHADFNLGKKMQFAH